MVFLCVPRSLVSCEFRNVARINLVLISATIGVMLKDFGVVAHRHSMGAIHEILIITTIRAIVLDVMDVKVRSQGSHILPSAWQRTFVIGYLLVPEY